MDSGLKQRLIGGAVLVALAVIFLPMLVKGPAPDSGRPELSLEMPAAPRGEMVTRDLPLIAPAASDGEPVLPAAEPETPAPTTDGGLPTVDTAAAEPASTPATDTAPGPALPATTAAGGYAVHFGSYGSSVNADTVVNRLASAGFPASSSEAVSAGKPVWRVRIGPYASRAEAETVRVAAAEVGTNDARVIALDAAPATAATKPGSPATSPPQVAQQPVAAPVTPPAAAPATPAPAPAAAAGTGFVVQLGAFRNAAEATAMRDRVRGLGFSAFTDTVQSEQGQLTRVKAGPVLDRAEADRLRGQIRGRAGIDGIVRSHP